MQLLRTIFIPFTLLGLFVIGGFAQSFPQDSQQSEHPQIGSADSRITGCVHDQTGIALESARVEAHDLRSGRLLASAYTNGNGIFELTGLPQGIYEIVALSGVNESRQEVKLQMQDTVVYFRIAIDGADADSI